MKNIGLEKEQGVQGRETREGKRSLWALGAYAPFPFTCLPPSCAPLFLVHYIFHAPATHANQILTLFFPLHFRRLPGHSVRKLPVKVSFTSLAFMCSHPYSSVVLF